MDKTIMNTEFLGNNKVRCSITTFRDIKTDAGVVTIQKSISTVFDTKDFIIDTLPKTCSHCPVGYMNSECGRNYPLDFTKRSDNCRLTTYRHFLDRNNISY